MYRLLLVLVSLVALVAAPIAHARMFLAEGEIFDNASTSKLNRLPTWVQVTSASATIYMSDTGARPAGSKLSRYTFLHVLAGSAARLQVDVYDEAGVKGIRGWVDLDNVLPSASGTDWLVSAAAAPLFRTAETRTDTLRGVNRFSPLQQLDGPVQNRVEVRVYRADFTVLDQGWMDVSAIGPALAPQVRVPSPTADQPLMLRSVSATNQQQAFLEATGQAARAASRLTGVPASVTVAQAILESDWGRSLLSEKANNYFGMKAIGNTGSDGVVWMPTSEYDDQGHEYDTVSAFRAYKSLTDSLTDHDRLLRTAPRYSAAMKVASDPRQFAHLLSQAGYSTDPAYADKLITLMDSYNLYRLDA